MAEYDSVDPSQTLNGPLILGFGTAGNDKLIVLPEPIIQPAISILILLYVPESNAVRVSIPEASVVIVLGPTEVPSSS